MISINLETFSPVDPSALSHSQPDSSSAFGSSSSTLSEVPKTAAQRVEILTLHALSDQGNGSGLKREFYDKNNECEEKTNPDYHRKKGNESLSQQKLFSITKWLPTLKLHIFSLLALCLEFSTFFSHIFENLLREALGEPFFFSWKILKGMLQ